MFKFQYIVYFSQYLKHVQNKQTTCEGVKIYSPGLNLIKKFLFFYKGCVRATLFRMVIYKNSCNFRLKLIIINKQIRVKVLIFKSSV